MAFQLRLNGTPRSVGDLAPTTTLLDWLRSQGLTGSKEGCAEGDCGACTVALLDRGAPGGPTWRAVCSCILLLPQVADQDVVTVEGLAVGDQLHPAQQALVEALGSQCGYCTPGFVMSLFEASYRRDLDCRWKKDDQICGNLCRCTGYRPIREALDAVAGSLPKDRFQASLEQPAPKAAPLRVQAEGARFDRPTSAEALWDILDEGPARILGGATDLGLDVTQRHARFDRLVDLGALPGMRELRVTEGRVVVGAGMLLADLERACETLLPALTRMLRFFGSRQIKNRATVGGNLCNASPIGDLAPVMLALDAEAVLRSRAGDRRVPMADFFTGYRQTALRSGEILARLEIPRPPDDAWVSSYKVSKRRELDISAVSAAFLVLTDKAGRCRKVRLAYGGMAATPARARHAEAALLGQPWDAGAVQSACVALLRDFTPMDDQRASAWFRNTVATNLLRGFFEECTGGSSPTLPQRPTATVLPGESA